ncbi:MAG: LuxR C-terminal-related transcriptional regulator [Dehalococcoidia bacterium]
MTVTTPSPMRTTREPQWTPRQREVLDLLVGGYTNSQIADRLNISLDGAKWHVSEIITRLGVDSRDEAAEYWRHHNGLRMRFTRIASGFFSSGALKWGMASAFLGGVVVVSAMVIIALREAGGDETEHGGSGVEDSATPGPTTVPTSVPTTVATPPPTGEVINGVSVKALTFTQPGVFPVPMSAIIEKGCYQCDGPTSAIERVTLDANGKPFVEQLFKPSNGYISSTYFESASGPHYLTVCSRGYCGGVGEISDDAQSTLYRSTDGGVTWQPLETYDGSVTVATVTKQGPLLRFTKLANGAYVETYQVYGNSTVIRPPAGSHTAYAGREIIGWQKDGTNEIVNFDGTPLVTIPDVDSTYPPRIADVLGSGEFLITWQAGPSPEKQSIYFGVLKNGALTSIYAAGTSTAIAWDWLNQGIAFGNVTLPDSPGAPLYPAMFDLTGGQIEVLELYGPVGSDAYNGQRNYLRLVEAGRTFRVTGAGDCLNVREQPNTSASVLGCYADNVLLRDHGGEQQTGGITWWKVGTPDGKEGWASREFLEGGQLRP